MAWSTWKPIFLWFFGHTFLMALHSEVKSPLPLLPMISSEGNLKNFWSSLTLTMSPKFVFFIFCIKLLIQCLKGSSDFNCLDCLKATISLIFGQTVLMALHSEIKSPLPLLAMISSEGNLKNFWSSLTLMVVGLKKKSRCWT